jgi:hypothetical protein
MQMNFFKIRKISLVLLSLVISPLFSPKKTPGDPTTKTPLRAPGSKISSARKKLTQARAYGATHDDDDAPVAATLTTGRPLRRVASNLSSTTVSASVTSSTRPGVETTYTRKKREEELHALQTRNARDLRRRARTMFSDDSEEEEAAPTLPDILEDPKALRREIVATASDMREEIAAAKLRDKDRARLEALVASKTSEEELKAKQRIDFLVQRRARITGRVEKGTATALRESELVSPRSAEDILARARLESIQHDTRAEEARRSRMSVSSSSDAEASK